MDQKKDNSSSDRTTNQADKKKSGNSRAAIFIIGIFVLAGIFTYYVGSEEDETDEPTVVEQYEGKAFQQATASNNHTETSTGTAEQKDAPAEPSQAEPETDPMEELDALIGLESVKEEVKSLANFVMVQKQREEQGLKRTKVSYHCVFTGNPGTGKTTVARLLARIYKNLGVVKRSDIVETDRSGLIGEYVGQTAPKTNALIDSALGGVLFIDEAYALVEKGGYGDEAIATLLKRMEDDRDNLVVIVAGYTEEMKDFIDANPGLRSRFTRYIEFPDYTSEELQQIFIKTRAERGGYKLSDDARKTLSQCLDQAVAQKTRNFGNGRYVRNLFEQAVTNQANRLADIKGRSLTKDELTTLTEQDIYSAYQQVKQ